MSFELVAVATGAPGASTGGTSSAIDTTFSQLLVVTLSTYGGGGMPSVSDNYGNTWTIKTPYSIGDSRNAIAYAWNPAVGPGHTFTVSGTEIYPSFYVQGWYAALTASDPFDQQNGDAANGATTLQTGSVTPSEDNELIVAAVTVQTGVSTFNIDSGFTVSGSHDLGAGIMGGAAAWLVQTSATAVNPEWTVGSSASMAVSIATFKAGAAAPTATYPGIISPFGWY